MKNFLNFIAMDKWTHTAFSIVISLIVAFADKKFFERETLVCATIGCLTAMFFGITKEVCDFFTGGRFDTKDLLADLVGCVIAFVLIVLLI